MFKANAVNNVGRAISAFEVWGYFSSYRLFCVLQT